MWIFPADKVARGTIFWRYVDSLGINQANAFLNILSALRERVWQLCDIEYHRIRISIVTTVETIFGNQQGGRKGHNTKYRGKKALRPILCFIDETREYLLGNLRKGQTLSTDQLRFRSAEGQVWARIGQKCLLWNCSLWPNRQLFTHQLSGKQF